MKAPVQNVTRQITTNVASFVRLARTKVTTAVAWSIKASTSLVFLDMTSSTNNVRCNTLQSQTNLELQKTGRSRFPAGRLLKHLDDITALAVLDFCAHLHSTGHPF